MSRELKVLERHFRHWRAKGLVGPEQETDLKQASAELVRSSTSSVVRIALGGLGAGLLLAGLVLIVAENWGAIPRYAKLGCWAALQVGFLYLAHWLGERFEDRPYLAEAFALLAGGWVLGGIALVSQIYHLDSRPPNGVWLWLALVLPAAWLLARRATAAVVLTALTVALALEVGEADSWLRATRVDSPWLFLAIPILAAGLVSWLPHPAAWLREWVGSWVFAASNFFLLVFGAVQEFDHTSLGNAWFLVASAGLLGFGLPARCLPRAWDGLTSRLLLALTLVPWAILGSQYDAGAPSDTLAVGLAWVIQLGLAVLVIRSAAQAAASSWVNAGYLALLAGIVTRYFDFFGEYLEGGTALAATGVLLLFILYSLEKARRRTLRKEALA
ncbi:MAG TPA: DUF2157 domain-containing protein [Vicinamibacteria bacterium]|nr:DUF2157 domain-containing protein [Vicinamibacteria bacterium]